VLDTNEEVPWPYILIAVEVPPTEGWVLIGQLKCTPVANELPLSKVYPPLIP
jgi:hypothetical protein